MIDNAIRGIFVKPDTKTIDPVKYLTALGINKNQYTIDGSKITLEENSFAEVARDLGYYPLVSVAFAFWGYWWIKRGFDIE